MSYWELRKKDFYRFCVFTQERFDPISHLMMMAFFLSAHYGLILITSTVQISPLNIILLFIGVAVFFFKLRLYDEIKDYELDLVINPQRPLARGYVTQAEVKRGIECALILEWILFAQAGLPGLLGIAIASGYSLLMYREFFIGNLIRPHLTTYATSHTVVTFFLSLAIFQGLSGLYFWQLPSEIYLFALVSWLLFNIFELGRKTYQKAEEKDQVESYSKVWTRPGAVLLVLLHGAISIQLLRGFSFLKGTWVDHYLLGTGSALALVGFLYLVIPKVWSGKLYRGFSSFFIILIYLGLILHLIL